jgi:tight adherence protein B
MNIYIPAFAIFIVTIVIIELIFWSARTIRKPERARIRKELKKISSSKYEAEAPDLMRKRVLSEIPALNEILLRITGIKRLDRLRYGANAKQQPGFFILLSLVIVGLGFVCLYLLLRVRPWYLAGFVSIFMGALPYLYLIWKKKKRMEKFQAQLPESLDLMARSLRAGHAFSTGMKLASEEFDDPLGPEFSVTLDEINFGLAVPDALKHLVNRVDCQDLNFFAVSVILQRETGGNLADIMQNIAHLIRERYKFYGKVRTLAAEGKLSMWVLIALPFAVACALYFVNRAYIMILFTEHIGKILLWVALVLMLIGAYVMRRIVDVEV